MKISKLLKAIKKSDGSFALILLFAIIGGLYVMGIQTVKDVSAERTIEQSIQVEEAQPVSAPLTVTVELRRVYLDGEISVEEVEHSILAMEDFWARYRDWQLIDQNKERLIFETKMDDISPLSKLNGYFGLSEDGILTIYDGSPKDNKVIESFYQVDVEKLESQLRDVLKKGIPIHSKQQFQSILNKFESYTLQTEH